MRPSVSLCMIARDEARFLAGCLESAAHVVDQIVLVDTGSVDDTVRIATECGAEIVHHPWNADFAAARNAGLEKARGSHVLVLDADERLAPGHSETLRAACARPDLGVGILPLYNADALDAQPLEVLRGDRAMGEPVHLPRVFPNHPELRYRRRVHERLAPDLEWLERVLGGRAVWIDAPIVHYGEVPELRAGRAKRVRNLELLERALAEDPDDADLAGYLACELYGAERTAEALAVAERYLPGLFARIDAAQGGAPAPCPVRLAGLLALGLIEAGESERALAVLTDCTPRAPLGHPNLPYLEGRAYEALGRFPDAAAAYRRALAGAGRKLSTPAFRGVTGASGRLRLVNCLLAQGRPEEALAELARVRGSEHVPAALARAEAYLMLGRTKEALRWLEPLERLQHPPGDLSALTGAARMAASTASVAAGAAADGALPDPGSGSPEEPNWLEPRRRAWLAGSGPAGRPVAGGR